LSLCGLLSEIPFFIFAADELFYKVCTIVIISVVR
jgi:hypothetical protein